jgi:catechol 2,3-dioxygenase-like lactoylglutathione lyase family enzyme
VQFNHTIIYARDQEETARFFTEILGLAEPKQFGPFTVLQQDNRKVSLDVLATDAEFTPQHYAFLVADEDFTEIFNRVKERGLQYWADPFHTQSGEINHNHGGQGFYFDDPNGHNLEVFTREYGTGAPISD